MRRLIFFVAGAALLSGGRAKTPSSAPPTGKHSSTIATTTAPGTATAASTQGAEALVHVYFLRDGKVAPVARSVSAPAVAVGALEQLRAGPSQAEQADGFAS